MEKIISIQPVQAYKTSDDKLFINERDAYDHEVEINFLHEITELLLLYDKAHFEVSSDQFNAIKNFIIEHRNELKEIFFTIMSIHKVVIEIEIEASNPLEAALAVRNMMNDSSNEWLFYVQSEDGLIYSFDLGEPSHDAVLSIMFYEPLIVSNDNS